MQLEISTPVPAVDDARLETVVERAFKAMADEGASGIAPALALMADAGSTLDFNDAQTIFVQIFAVATEGLDGWASRTVYRALVGCPPALAADMRRFLHAALLPDGHYDPSALPDTLLLCDLALHAAEGAWREAIALLISEAPQRSQMFHNGVEQLHPIIDPYFDFKPKLLIWDLDDTLWQGTLAEGDELHLLTRRAEIATALNQHGIISAICSKNDFETAKAKLETLNLWDSFVFPRIAFAPKGAVIANMIADMQLRPQNVLFIDDNPHNLHEAAAFAPGIRTIDARTPECDALLERILVDHQHVTRDRRDEYRILQWKAEERQASALAKEDFLQSSDVRVLITQLTENVQFADRIEELINRSNQLNYTNSRVAAGSMTDFILNFTRNFTYAVFVRDKYGDYGLVGFASVDCTRTAVEHFVLSCRVMHMGVEAAMLDRIHLIFKVPKFPAESKPLPLESSKHITLETSEDPENLERIRKWANEAPARNADLRIMFDCQSGALQHYSRHRDTIDIDGYPRLFSLPMMETGEYARQHFPKHLVLAATTDYHPWRWVLRKLRISRELYARCARAFSDHLAQGDHRLLVVLPPEDCPDHYYYGTEAIDGVSFADNYLFFNELWRTLAAERPDQIQLLELTGKFPHNEMTCAGHYFPQRLRELSGWIDDWYAAAREPS
ncbi:HAD-IIIC family phosphatase [Sphingomonas azotifigens]|uniref:HAD-IIIC family phosphatase n=1 Tax=Sphingomonas azotifigens TaxID=330920 RepID=UPI0009FC46F0|nr:HAD-IIIC family phosphatase [Sphingomonas azotifigens]